MNELEVAETGSMSGYSREIFEHWSRANDFGWDAPEDSCNAREAALIRDGENVEVGSGCKVTSRALVRPVYHEHLHRPTGDRHKPCRAAS